MVDYMNLTEGEGQVLRDAQTECSARLSQMESDIGELEASLATANTIIDKLPKYADTGEPIVPGQDYVWLIGPHWLGDDPVCQDDGVKAKLVSWWGDHAAVMIEGADDCDHWDGPMYSTAAAAQAATKE